MPSDTFTLESIGAELERVAARLSKATLRGCRRAAVEARTAAVKFMATIEPYPPIDTGELRRSYTVTPLNYGARLENVAPHAANVEWGTKPHFVPLPTLVAWAGRKLRGSGKRGKKRAAAAHAWAKGTQKKIEREGTEGRLYHTQVSVIFPDIKHEALLRELRKVRR